MKQLAQKAFLVLSILGLSAAVAQGPAMAQVVNSGPGSTSSNSQVTLSASIPSVVIVRVNQGTSTLTKTVSAATIDAAANTASTDFTILGNVIVNSPTANVQCTVSSTTLSLVNGADSITAALTGTIGGTNIATTGFTPTFSSRQAAINIVGDIAETTVTSTKAPGTYTGTLTITANLL